MRLTEKGANLELSTGNLEILLTKSNLSFRINGEEVKVSSKELEEIFTVSDNNLYSIVAKSTNGSQELFVLENELTILRIAEQTAAYYKIKLLEHTGRSVESDEHGLSVLQQISKFPERWPDRKSEKISLSKVSNIGNITQIEIPSKLDNSHLQFYILGSLITLLIGAIVDYDVNSISISLILGLMPFCLFTILLGVYAKNTNKFASKHTMTISKYGIFLQGKFLGLFALNVEQFGFNEFKDLDVSNGKYLTFLFGERRFNCEAEDDISAEFLLAEIVESLTLRSDNDSEE